MYLHEYSLAHPGFGEPAQPLPKVIQATFQAANGSKTDPENCCPICTILQPGFGPGTGITRLPFKTGINLGVGRAGTASNGMELQFTLSGHRSGIEYDIKRKRRHSIWQRRAGVWTKLELSADGIDDDRDNTDECLTPVNNRLFAIDATGYPSVKLPRPDGTRWVTSTPGVATDADASDVVVRATFAEWVIARSVAEKIPWKIISPGPFTFWHSVLWLTRDVNSNWVLGPCSKITLGALSAAILDSPPLCGTPTPRELAAEAEARRWTEQLLETMRTNTWLKRRPRPVPFEF